MSISEYDVKMSSFGCSKLFILFLLIIFLQNIEFTLTQYDRSYHLNSNNFANQLTKNYQNPNGRASQLTEEERNRLNALNGITKIDEPIPRADDGISNAKTYLITSGRAEQSGDLSNVKITSSKLTLPLGQDLTELSPTNRDPFAERNGLFNRNKYSFSNSSPLEATVAKPVDDLNDFSYLYRKPQPPQSHPQQHTQSQNYAQIMQSIQTVMSNGAQTVNNLQTSQQTLPATGPTFHEESRPTIQNSIIVTNNNIQQTGLIPQLNFKSTQIASNNKQDLYAVVEGRGIGRFDTNIPRYSFEPPASASRNRIVLDSSNPILSERISIDAYLKNTRTEARLPADFELKSRVSSFGPSEVIGGNSQTARTRVLMKGSLTPIELPESSEQARHQNIEVTPSTRNFTTYPNFKADLFPSLDNQAKEDPRPATGRRLGAQDRFGGGTNEYREDLGKNWGINDRRPPWMHAPGMGANANPSAPQAPLNRYAQKVLIENYPPNAPSNEIKNQRKLGDDLTRTDAMGHNSYGPNYLEYTTPAPYPYNGEQTTTIIGVPMNYMEESNRNTNGPASRFIGSGINPNSQRIILSAATNSTSTTVDRGGRGGGGDGKIQEYYGPEEITGSRYRQLDEYFNNGDVGRGRLRYVKMDLLNE